MFQRPSASITSGAGAAPSSSLRITSLSRDVSTESDDFVMLTPSAASALHARTPSDEFEMVGAYGRSPSSGTRSVGSGSLAANPLSRETSTSDPTSGPSLSRVPSHRTLIVGGGGELDLPPMSRAATDYFLARAAAEEARAAAQAREAENADSASAPPSSLPLSRRSSNHRLEAAPQVETVREEYGDDGQYGEEEDEEPEPASPRTIAAHEAEVRYAAKQAQQRDVFRWAYERQLIEDREERHQRAEHLDPSLRQRHQSSLGQARVTHKSLQTRKEKKAATVLALQKRTAQEQKLQQHVPAVVPTRPEQRLSQATSSSSNSRLPVSDAVADHATAEHHSFITLADIARHLASTVAPEPSRCRPQSSRTQRRNFHYQSFYPDLINVALPRPLMTDFPDLQRAFYNHNRAIIIDNFHSAARGLQLVTARAIENAHYRKEWCKILLDMLNEEKGSGVEHTRIQMVYRHPPSCAHADGHSSPVSPWRPVHNTEADCRNHCQSAEPNTWLHLPGNSQQVFTPLQVHHMHARFAPQKWMHRVDDQLQIVANGHHTVFICALLQGWSEIADGVDAKRVMHFEEVGHSTIVHRHHILLPMFEITYKAVDELAESKTATPKEVRRAMDVALAQSKRTSHDRTQARKIAHQTLSAELQQKAERRRFEVAPVPLPSQQPQQDRRVRATAAPVDQSLSDLESGGEEEPVESRSYLGEWGSVSELQARLIERQAELEAAEAALDHAARHDLSDHEIAQHLAYLDALEIEQRAEEQRANDERAERAEQEHQRALFEQLYPDSEEHDEDEVYHRTQSRSVDARAAALASPYDDLDVSVRGPYLARGKQAPVSAVLSTALDGSLAHHNHDAGRYMRVWAKKHVVHQSDPHHGSKMDLSFPVKPRRQERLENKRNYRTHFFNAEAADEGASRRQQ